MSHKGIVCDGCSRSDFSGKRYHCLICYDYDLCSECVEEKITTKSHETTHQMHIYEIEAPSTMEMVDPTTLEEDDGPRLSSKNRIIQGKADFEASVVVGPRTRTVFQEGGGDIVPRRVVSPAGHMHIGSVPGNSLDLAAESSVVPEYGFVVVGTQNPSSFGRLMWLKYMLFASMAVSVGLLIYSSLDIYLQTTAPYNTYNSPAALIAFAAIGIATRLVGIAGVFRNQPFWFAVYFGWVITESLGNAFYLRSYWELARVPFHIIEGLLAKQTRDALRLPMYLFRPWDNSALGTG